MNKNEALALIAELTHASQVYYQDLGESPLTDEEFDAKLNFLGTLVDVFPELFAEGTEGFALLENDPSLGSKPQADKIIAHSIPMLSLKKAKTEAEVLAWAMKLRNEGAKDFQLQAKLDGFALCARYENGKLVILATRGDGEVGEDTTYLINDPRVTVVGLPAVLASTTDTLEVRGELFFSEAQFQAVDDTRAQVQGERFKNSRNAVVGLMKKAKKGVDYDVEFTFATYSVYKNGELADLTGNLAQDFTSVVEVTQAQDTSLKLTGFADDAALVDAVNAFGISRAKFTIPTDGVVIKPTNESAMHQLMGNTSHHPVSQIAFKYPAATAVTTLESIDITVGKTGKITPIGRVKPTPLAGTVISNISLHNFNWIHNKNVRVGSIVEITRANDVIPQIQAVLVASEAELMAVPTECPICMTELKGVKDEDVWPPRTLRCDNLSCPSRDFYALKAAVGKNYLDIDGLSEVSLTHLNDIGRVNTIDEIFTLTVEELTDSQLGTSSATGNARKLGEKRARHIVEHIEKAKSAPLYRLIASLNITGLGIRMAKDLVKEFGSIENILNASYDDIVTMDKMGDIRARTLVEGFAHRRELIERMMKNGVKFTPEVVVEDAPEGISLAGMAFAISGAVPEPFANRTKWVEYVESKGGKFDSSPKKTTSFMVGDKDENSSKIKKARDLGVEFVTADEFTARFTG